MRLYLLDIQLLLRAVKLAWWVQRKIGWRPIRTAYAAVWVAILLTLPADDTFLTIGTAVWLPTVSVAARYPRGRWDRIGAMFRIAVLALFSPTCLLGVGVLLTGHYPHSLHMPFLLLAAYVKECPDGPDEPSELRQALDRLSEQLNPLPQGA